MGIDLKLVNELWYGIKEENPADYRNRWDYPTVLAVGVFLLQHPEIAKQFIDETWNGESK